jgi:hypothetical protein
MPQRGELRLTAERTFGRNLLSAIGPGALAGIAGGVTIDAYLLVVGALTHALSPERLYTFIASALVGQAASALPGMFWLGVALHAAISIAWGVGFAYAAVTTPQITARPYFSGIVFGFVVFVVMQLMMALAGIVTRIPSPGEVLMGIVAHTLFFGIPVALVVTRRLGA